MRKIALVNRIQILGLALVLVSAGASAAFGDDRFALAPSGHDNLVIFGPKGDKVADLSIPTISQSVTVGSTSFQISYGRDANNYITAIIAPSSAQPQDLHFTVLNKAVDADKQAVVTLTFPDPKHVVIDPGYIGSVTVDSHTLHHTEVADAPPVPAPTPSIPHATPRVTADVQPQEIPAPSHVAPVSRPASVAKQTTTTTSSSAPLPVTDSSSSDVADGSQPVPITPPTLLGSLMSQPPPAIPPHSGAPPSQKLYWAEPITPPNGAAPSVGIDQMKLVSVQGPVTVTTPNGDTKTGTNGMIVPSGSTVSTSNNASAAVFIGGVDSARLLPNTDAKVTEKLDGSTRHTNINLKNGTVFSRVGHRPGEKQDYEVRTPEGVAAARGTSYAVGVVNSGGHQITVVATSDGVVTMTDSSDGHVITVTPLNSGQVALGSVPHLPSAQLASIFQAFLADVQQFNTNMAAIAANPNPTAAELAYYNANTAFDANTQFYDANSGSLATIFTPPNIDAILNANSVNNVVPATRRAINQILEPFGDVPLTPF